jgi:ABC-type sulfate transport system substrate-binding protein
MKTKIGLATIFIHRNFVYYGQRAGGKTLLNVSYDPTRELYQV